MAKKKKKTGRKRTGNDAISNMTTAQLLDKAKQSLEVQKSREAINYLKQAGKKDGVTGPTQQLLFKAYLLRAKQLREKGLLVEAASMVNQTRELIPSYDKMTEEDLQAFVENASGDEAIKVYKNYLACHDPCPSCETVLADRILADRHWEQVKSLPSSSRLKDHLDDIKQAVGMMDEGKWEEAVKTLQPVSSKSPFAALRMFCRGMAAFLADDVKTMQKAFSLIPENFALMPVVKIMQQSPLSLSSAAVNDKDLPVLTRLWEGPVTKEKYLAELLANLTPSGFKRLKASIEKLAKIILPHDPIRATVFILKCMWSLFIFDHWGPDRTIRLMNSLLPSKTADLLMSNLMLLMQSQPFTAGGENIVGVDRMFTEPTYRDIAKSLILSKILEQVVSDPATIYHDRDGVKRYHRLLGITEDTLKRWDTEQLMLEIASEGLRLDPDNRELYTQAVRLPHYSRKAKATLEALLEKIAAQFPDDPWPCLELSGIYYEKNAYRKAENILAEAMKRAPHDRRVIERHVISLLISTFNNLKRSRFNLAWKDIERAEQFSTPKTAPLIAEKKILLDMLDRQQPIDQALEAAAGTFDPPDQLKILVLLNSDIKHKSIDVPPQNLRPLEKMLVKAFKNIKRLPSGEILQLLLPWAREYWPMIPGGRLIDGITIKNYNVLAFLNHTDFSRVLERIIDRQLIPVIRKQIKKRLKADLTQDDRIRLEFYQIVLLHITKNIYEFDKINTIAQAAKGDLKEELRQIARKLADFTDQFNPLHMALERFDFDRHNDINDFFVDDDDEDFWDEEEEECYPDEDSPYLEDIMMALMPLMMHLDELTPHSSPKVLMSFIRSLEHFISAASSIGIDVTDHSDPILQMMYASSDFNEVLDTARQLIERYRPLKISNDAMNFIYGGKNEI